MSVKSWNRKASSNGMDYKQTKHGLLHGLLTRDQFCLTKSFEVVTRIKDYNISIGKVTLMSDGNLHLSHGYTWDGASGPTWDTECTIIASAVHDALYQLMAADQLPKKERWKADGELWFLMRKHGAGWFRAAYYLAAVQVFGRRHI